jgi:hypothetical protein
MDAQLSPSKAALLKSHSTYSEEDKGFLFKKKTYCIDFLKKNAHVLYRTTTNKIGAGSTMGKLL